MKQIHVAAAIIIHNHQVLSTQRSYGEYQGWWEFPGGKINPNETPVEALKREIKEELAAEIIIDQHLITTTYTYPTFHLTMDCYLCRLENNQFTLLEHQAYKWLSLNELDTVKWLQADLAVLEVLKDTQVVK